MKRIFAYFLSFLMLFNLTVFAENDGITINVIVKQDDGVVNVSGYTTLSENIFLMITDAELDMDLAYQSCDKIYALVNGRVSLDGNYNVDIPLPDDMGNGTYRVLIGGLGEIDEKSRSKTFRYTGGNNTYSLWIEGEDATSVYGDYKTVIESSASEEKVLVLDSVDDSVEHKVDYVFDIPYSDEYDIWILSTPGNQSYVSEYRWKLDDRDYMKNGNASMSNVYTTTDSRQVGVSWSKLGTEKISENMHSLSFYCPDRRMANNQDFYYHVVDSILIVPSSWEWTPNKIIKPFAKSLIDGQIVSVRNVPEQIDRGDTVTIRTIAKLRDDTEIDCPIFAALYYGDEFVAGTTSKPYPTTDNWIVGQEYSVRLSLSLPTYAPDGEYTLVCGLGYPEYQIESSRSDSQKIVVGETAQESAQKLNISNIDIKNSSGKIEVNFTSDVQYSGKTYLKLYDEQVFWGVCESMTDVIVGKNTTIFEIPQGIPDGNYTAIMGIYGINSTSENKEILISGGNDDKYKPLSNGIYLAKRTGKEHFWYVNQAGTLIWDGEPYIPMGGMECPRLLSGYAYDNVVSNEEKWQEDLDVLQTLKEEGIRDIYINPVRAGSDIPKYIWQHVLNTLDDMGFCYGFQYGNSNRDMEVFYPRANDENGKISTTISSDGIATATVSSSAFEQYGDIVPQDGIFTVVDDEGRPVMCGSCSTAYENDTLTFTADVDGLTDGENYTVYFTPKFYKTASILVNYWDYGESILADASTFAQNIELGDGFRNIIDPLANESGFYNGLESIRPTGNEYEELYAKWLEDKYITIDALNTSWGSDGISDFSIASRLIPVYTTQKSQDYNVWYLDTKTEELYKTDGRNGLAWYDFLDFRDSSFAEFNSKVANAFKTGLDVPVVVKNVWGHKEYFKNKEMVGGIDGLGVEAYGSHSGIRNLIASSYGMAKSFSKTAWLIVTETADEENIETKYNSGDFGYESELYMNTHFDTLYNAGAKGIYDFLMSARHNEKTNTAYSYIENDRQFDWLNVYIDKMDIADICEYVPDVTMVYVMPYNSNYYTIPNRDTAVHYNDSFSSIRQPFADEEKFVMNTMETNIYADVLIANFENGPMSVRVGKDFGEFIENIPKDQKVVYAGFRKDIGTVPQLDKYFTSDYGKDVNGRTVQILAPPKNAEILAVTTEGKPYAFRYGRLWVIAYNEWFNKDTVTVLDEFNIIEASTQISVTAKVYPVKDIGQEGLTDGDWICEGDVINFSNGDSFDLFIAKYSSTENRLLSAEKTTVKEESFKKMISVDSEVDEVRVYFWDGMIPIIPTIYKERLVTE